MRNQWEPGEDIIDLRDVVEEMERINGLDPQDLEPEDIEFLASVEDLNSQLYGGGLEDAAQNDPIMILESYFETYAQEFAEEIGAIDQNGRWPSYCIDWERAANDLAMDFSLVEFGGYNYYMR